MIAHFISTHQLVDESSSPPSSVHMPNSRWLTPQQEQWLREAFPPLPWSAYCEFDKSIEMARSSWTTPEQKSWLQEVLPAYGDAVHRKDLPMFLLNLTEEWVGRFGWDEPTADEVTEAGGNALVLQGLRKRFWKRVRYCKLTSGSGTDQ